MYMSFKGLHATSVYSIYSADDATEDISMQEMYEVSNSRRCQTQQQVGLPQDERLKSTHCLFCLFL